MKKKEIAEIKKQLSIVNCNITRIATCLVAQEKECIPLKTEAFLSLPEEEMFKYFDLFQKALSGSLGKNLFDVQFPREDRNEKQSYMELLRKSRLEDEQVLEEFYKKAAKTYEYNDNYLIILIHGMYDIPGRGSDNAELFDASEEVYEYIQCIFCPVSLSKPGLTFSLEENRIKDRIRDRIVEKPMDGFLYPAFNERTADINELLYYTKKSSETQVSFLECLTGNVRPASDEEKKEWMKQAFSYSSEDETVTLQQVQNFFEKYHELIEETNDGFSFSPKEMRKLTEASGIGETQAEKIEKGFVNELGTNVSVSGFMDTKSFTLQAGATQIKTSPEHAGDLTVKRIDGRLSLVIPLETSEAEINGIAVRLIDAGKN